jgi:UDP-N-acetylmuramoyl-tripeptide--D-alanyl-D-alanine ligase
MGHGANASELAAIARAAAGSRTLHLLDDVDRPTGVADVPVHGQAGELTLRLDTFDGSTEIALLGVHNLANAALAFHAVVAAGIPPAAALAGLSHAVPVAGRLVPRPAGIHLVLDDTYNANPASMIAGLRVLANCPGRHLAILGPMGELGAALVEGHRAVGAEAKRLGVPLIVVAGRGALAGAEVHLAAGYGPDAQLVADRTAALTAARSVLSSGATTVLVKASRSQGLEHVVAGLCTPIPVVPSAGADHPC